MRISPTLASLTKAQCVQLAHREVAVERVVVDAAGAVVVVAVAGLAVALVAQRIGVVAVEAEAAAADAVAIVVAVDAADAVERHALPAVGLADRGDLLAGEAGGAHRGILGAVDGAELARGELHAQIAVVAAVLVGGAGVAQVRRRQHAHPEVGAVVRDGAARVAVGAVEVAQPRAGAGAAGPTMAMTPWYQRAFWLSASAASASSMIALARGCTAGSSISTSASFM